MAIDEKPLAQAATSFIDRIYNREAVIGVLGLGYVGLPLVLAFHKAGFRCIGFDVDQGKIDSLIAGRTYIAHIGDDKVAALSDSGRFSATSDFSVIGEVDAAIICVPTPLTTHRDPDMRYVESTARAIAPYLKRGQIVTLESTTYPMTSEGMLLRLLENGSGLRGDHDFAIAYSPEREDPGNPSFETQHDPEDRRRRRSACRRHGDGALRRNHFDDRPGVVDAGGRGGQTDREYFPRRQHRPRQRDEDRSPTRWASTSSR